MKNSFLLILIVSIGFNRASAQQRHLSGIEKDSIFISGQGNWSALSNFKDIGWDNYSTSFVDPDKMSAPIIVTAIPYHGVYPNFDDIHADLDLSFDSSLFRFSSNFSNTARRLYTYDSAEVYFLAPGIYPKNAKDYQYRILLNGEKVIQSWKEIKNFADSSFALNNFKKGMAFLGGYKADWNNYLVLELKKTHADTILSAAVVYWKQVKPKLIDIYTMDELNIFLARLKKPYDQSGVQEDPNKWKARYSPGEIDSSNGLPKKLMLASDQKSIIFFLKGDIYKKEALEYQLTKDGMVYNNWKPNDFDNNVIWLKNLIPGSYQLMMRFRAQRHNITSYQFDIKPAWFQTATFKIVVTAVVMLIAFLVFWLWRLKQKASQEKVKKDKFNLSLKTIRSQLNPHFIFNALSSIQGLINKNEVAAANLYLTEFSNLLRQSLKNQEQEYVLLGTELKILETYIKLEQLRFHFQYKINVDEKLHLQSIEIPSLLIQPLIENAIKHGAGPKHQHGLLTLKFVANGKNLIIDIADNGPGFNESNTSTGFGLRLVNDRIELLNSSMNDQRISLFVNPHKNDTTIVTVTFFNWI